jgi:starch-binding outer membrane protein, SusD/RagB family
MIIGLLFTNCEDVLDVKPQSLISAQSMWENEEDAKSGINGMLNRFRSTFNGNNFWYWFELRSGNWHFGLIGGGAGSAAWDDLFNNTLNPSSSPGTDWTNLYATINSANLAIKYITQIEFTNDNDKMRLLAQAYFVRAFTYFALARIYGDVPIVLNGFESADAEDMYPKRRPVADVFVQIKEDIDIGLDLFPDAVTILRIKPTQAALNMLKADVYLWTAKRLNGGSNDLSIALDGVDAVLSDSNYELLSSYENVFRTDNNNETIFSLYFDIIEGGTQYYEKTIYSTADVPSEYQNNPVLVGSWANTLMFNEFYIETYLNRVPNDSRKSINFGELVVNGQTFRWGNKYIGEWRDGVRYFTSNTLIYRFAEALLFKAEILNAQGNNSEAVEYLNQIARRAYGVDNFYSANLSQAEVDNAILDERLVEFGAEGKAWFDIIRFGKAFERIPALIGREDDNQGNILLFPIAPETITRNSNIKQTPGY